MVELEIPDLTTEQIEVLCSIAENAARGHILSKIPSKQVERLDIAVEAKGSKPVSVTVEIDLLVTSEAKNVSADALVKEATGEALKAAEEYLRKIK